MAKFIPTNTVYISFNDSTDIATSHILLVARRLLTEAPDLAAVRITRSGLKKNVIATVYRGERPGEILESFDVQDAVAPTKDMNVKS